MHTFIAFLMSIIMGIGSLLGLSTPTSTASATSSSSIGLSATSSEPSPSSIGKAISSIFSALSPASNSTDALPAGSPWLAALPLGDYKYVTSGPKKGYIYICNVVSGGQGAKVNGPWIQGDTWKPSEKVHVQGSVSWPQATYSMKITGQTRTVSSNDLPTDHTTGVFPISASDPAAQYDRNPGSIAAHSYSFSFAAYPIAAAKPGCIYGEVGILNDGVLLFDGFDALYRDALAHELQDAYDGHPNNEGYHDHGFISEIKNVSVSQVVGFAFDGYPITGPELPSGKYLTTSDLDECHGMTSSIMLDGKSQESYHYVLTQDFPYSVSCFHGTSKVTPQTLRAQGLGTNSGTQAVNEANQMSSQEAQMAQQQGGGNPPAPPQEAISACSGKSSGSSCSVGPGSGTCQTIGTYFACVPGN